MDLHVCTTFDTIIEAKIVIKAFIADAVESWKSTHSDKERFDIVCKQQRSCTFRIRATNSKKKGITITHLQPHSCNPSGHSRASNTNSIEYLLPHHRAAIRDHPAITPKQIQSAERLQYFNNIPYLQAYRVKQAVLIEMWGNESKSFALFPDFIARFKAANRDNKAYISTRLDGIFEAGFFCPRGLQKAGAHVRGFTAIDGTHTKSR